MLTTTAERLEQPRLARVELIIPVSVRQTIKTGTLRAFGIGVETAMGEEQSHGGANRGCQRLDLTDSAVGIGVESQQWLGVALGGDHDAPSLIKGHAHPRSFIRRRGAQQRHLKAWGNPQRLGRGCRSAEQNLTPGADPMGSKTGGGLPA